MEEVYVSVVGDTSESYRDVYTYDAASRVASISQEGGTYSSQVWTPGGNTVEKYVSFDWDIDGRLDEIVRKTSSTGSTIATTDYLYDGRGRLRSITHDLTAQADDIEYAYQYDQADRVTRLTRSLGVSEDWRADYAYDETGQLVEALYDGNHYLDATDEVYTFDENGNRTLDGYETGQNNQLLADGTYTYTYDAEGNLTARFIDVDEDGVITITQDTDITTYEWDRRNRLTAVAFDDGDGQLDKRVEYTYDVFNQLIGKTVDDDGDGNPDRAEIYVWDRGQILLDFVDDNAGDGLDDFEVARRYLHGPLVDQVLAQEDAATGDVDWLLADHQATIRDLVRWDDANTETDYIQQYQYDTFGNLVAITDITGTVDYTDRSYAVTRYQYTGRDWDADSGLQYNRMRWYDPATGRWINEDPIGFAGGDANLVSYADNAVTIFVDPSGLKVFWVKRRLDGLPVGNHGYLLIIPDEPDKFSGLIDVYGGKKGFTLGGHRGADDDDKGCLILISNQKADVAAVREFHDSDRYEKEEKRADEGEDSDYYKSKWQHAQNEIEPPKGMTDTE